MDILVPIVLFVVGVAAGASAVHLYRQYQLKKFIEDIDNDLQAKQAEYAAHDLEATLSIFQPGKVTEDLSTMPKFIKPATDAQLAEADHYDRQPREVLIYETLAEEYDAKKKEKP